VLVVRFKVRARPEAAGQVAAALERVIVPSRALPGVLEVDIARCLDDPNTFIATEVYEDRAALDRQEALPVVEQALALIRESEPVASDALIYHVSTTERFS
jgi:quinol monooxygenase YgiN